MLSYRKGFVYEALGSRRMNRIFLLQEWVSTAARASASAPRTPCAPRGRADALAQPLLGWAPPQRCVCPAGPSVLVAVDSLSLFISQLVRSSPQTGAHRHVRSQSHQNPLQNTHRLVQGLMQFMPHQLLINLNNLYNEEKDILQKWLLDP